MALLNDAIKGVAPLFDVIKGDKWFKIKDHAENIETALRTSAGLLSGIRKYLLESPNLGGENSPFVKQIDKILDRPLVKE